MDDTQKRLEEILSSAESAHENTPSIVLGSNVVVGSGTITNTTYTTPPIIHKTVVVKTGDGVIDAAQKLQIQLLIKDWVQASQVRKKPKTYASAWISLYKQVKVNKYDEIKKEQYEDALKWLHRQIAICMGMKSAPKKTPLWRGKRIGAIQAHCNELDLQEWRRQYMKERFGKSSMKEMTDNEIQALYLAVMKKKP